MLTTSTIEMLAAARRSGRAVGAFNVGNMEMVMGVIQAAEEAGAPVILQVAEKRLGGSPLDLMGPLMLGAAGAAGVEVGVQLDHGLTLECIRQAMDMGFTSVMFDGSQRSLAENIAVTTALVKEAAARGVAVEAEVGVIGGSEGGPEHVAQCCDPEEARALAVASGCAALGVAVGNAHGRYRGKPELNFAVLEKVASLVETPLVLHGGTGIPVADLRRAIGAGIAKINIATALFEALAGNAAESADRPGYDYFKLSEAMVLGAYEAAREYIAIFNSRV